MFLHFHITLDGYFMCVLNASLSNCKFILYNYLKKIEILTHFFKKVKSISSKINIWKLYENVSTKKAQKLSNSFLVFITLYFLSFSDIFLTIKPFLPDGNCMFSEQPFLTVSKN